MAPPSLVEVASADDVLVDRCDVVVRPWLVLVPRLVFTVVLDDPSAPNSVVPEFSSDSELPWLSDDRPPAC